MENNDINNNNKDPAPDSPPNSIPFPPFNNNKHIYIKSVNIRGCNLEDHGKMAALAALATSHHSTIVLLQETKLTKCNNKDETDIRTTFHKSNIMSRCNMSCR